jgi:large subunit ribosomal protein L9
MKVIFIKDLKKQGKVNEVKEVSDGYATNFLIKNGYAVKYTKTSSKILNKDLENKKIQEEENIKNAEELKKKIESITLKFKVQSNNGKVFGSISTKQIHEELLKQKINIDKKKIKIDTALSSLGVHIVKINLHKKVTAELKVQLWITT